MNWGQGEGPKCPEMNHQPSLFIILDTDKWHLRLWTGDSFAGGVMELLLRIQSHFFLSHYSLPGYMCNFAFQKLCTVGCTCLMSNRFCRFLKHAKSQWQYVLFALCCLPLGQMINLKDRTVCFRKWSFSALIVEMCLYIIWWFGAMSYLICWAIYAKMDSSRGKNEWISF